MKKLYLLILLAVSMSFAELIGYLNAENSNYGCAEPFSIFVDTENHNDQSGVRYGEYSSSKAGVVVGNGGVTFNFCTANPTSLKRTRFDYAVLSLESKCPAGSYRYGRHHDTQDGGHNSYTGNIGAIDVGNNVTFYFCFVPKDMNAEARWPSHWTHGVFAYFEGGFASRYEIYLDDEDSHNDNSWPGKKDLPKDIQNRIETIMNGSPNTTYQVAHWYNHTYYYFAKSAEVAETPSSSRMQYVAAAPLAPAVKGLNRNAVAVELKSAGDVKVSIVGANGAVIANIAEKNLQAGSHQIKWNAGMVPSGRYVVKVEQNGMVNTKNVILK